MKNEHGVEVVAAVGGRYTIPKICSLCKHHEYEIGEMGTVLCGSYCAANLWFPTKKGTCKKFIPYRHLFVSEEDFEKELKSTSQEATTTPR